MINNYIPFYRSYLSQNTSLSWHIFSQYSVLLLLLHHLFCACHACSAVFLRQVQTLLLQSISLSFVLYTSLIIFEQPISVLFLVSIAGSSLVEQCVIILLLSSHGYRLTIHSFRMHAGTQFYPDDISWGQGFCPRTKPPGGRRSPKTAGSGGGTVARRFYPMTPVHDRQTDTHRQTDRQTKLQRSSLGRDSLRSPQLLHSWLFSRFSRIVRWPRRVTCLRLPPQ